DGEVTLIDGCWFVTHTGLMRLSLRNRCQGIRTEPIAEFCDSNSSRYCFKATVYKSPTCKGFVAYGDADPSNVSPLVHGAEMRIAETRAVNRALRKAYGIGVCSLEEVGSVERFGVSERSVRKFPPPSSNGSNGNATNGNGTRVRDQLCQLIRQHQLDANLVKAY